MVISQESYFRDMQQYDGIVVFEPNMFEAWAPATMMAYSTYAQNATKRAQRLAAFQQRFDPVRLLRNAQLLPAAGH